MTRYSVNGKALSSLRIEEIRDAIKERDIQSNLFQKKSVLRQILSGMLDNEKKNPNHYKNINNNNNNTSKKRKSTSSSSSEEYSDSEDEYKEDEDQQQEKIENILTKLKNKRIKHHHELAIKTQKVTQLEKNIIELNKKVKELEDLNNNKLYFNKSTFSNNNNGSGSDGISIEDQKKAIKLYKRVKNEIDFDGNVTNIQMDMISEEFIKFIVLKVMDKDYKINSSSKLLPSPLISSFWKKFAINTHEYIKLLKVVGNEIHYNVIDKEDLKKVEKQKLNRKKYKRTIKLYKQYFPESFLVQICKDNNSNDSIWPINYLKLPKSINTTTTTISTTTTTTTAQPTTTTTYQSAFKYKTFPPISSNSDTVYVDLQVESDYEILYFNIKRTESFVSMFKYFKNKGGPNVIFKFNGIIINQFQTPQMLSMNSDDKIIASYSTFGSLVL